MGQYPDQLAENMSGLFRKGAHSHRTRREFVEIISPDVAGVDS
jgi:hypothetical protein